MATIRKHGRKWQSIIRKKKIVVRKSFWKKSDARLWSDKTEAQIEVGSYLGINIVLPFEPIINLFFVR